MFPDTEARMRDIHKIHRSARILPHDQNTGGFYLALIRKKAHAVFEWKGMPKTKIYINKVNAPKTDASEQDQVINVEAENETAIEELDKKLVNELNVDSEPVIGGKDHEEAGEEGISKVQKGEEGLSESDDLEQEKVGVESGVEKDKEEEKLDEGNKGEVEKKVKRRRKDQPAPKKVTFDNFEPNEWEWIKEYYGIEDTNLKGMLIQQTVGDRNVYMVSPGIKKILDMERQKGKGTF